MACTVTQGSRRWRQIARKTVAKSTQKKASKIKVKRAGSGRTTPDRPSTPAKSAAKSTTKARVEVRPSNGRGSKGGNDKPASPVIAQAPATPAKSGKNQAGLKAKELEFFRDLLIAKRRELLGDVHSMEEEALRSASGSNLSNLPIHMADMGTDNYEQEFTLGLVEKDRQLLREINVALGKIRDGTYGICEGTGKPISKVRLEAQPWARYSIEHARKMEKGFIR